MHPKRSFIYCALISSTVFTAAVIHYSINSGRLSTDPTYDDVRYLHEGLKLTRSVYEHGIAAPLLSIWESPPHSPLATLLAAASFSIFGFSEISPYLSNFLSLLLLLIISLRVSNPSSPIRVVVITLFTLSVPFSFWAIHEFRPDFYCALFTALSAAGLILANLTGSSQARSRNAKIAGLFAGLAIFAKPTFFAHTSIIFGVSIIFYLYHIKKDEKGVRKLMRAAIGPSSFFLLIALPTLFINFSHTIKYFLSNTLGKEGHIWRIKGGVAESVDYYLINGQGASMLGRFSLPLLLFSIVGYIVLGKKHQHAASALLRILLILAISCAIIVWGAHNNPFFNLTGQILLLICALFSFRYLQRFKAGIVLGLALLAVGTYWQSSTPIKAAIFSILNGQQGPRPTQFNAIIIDALSTKVNPSDKHPKSLVFVTTAGSVNASTLEWMSEFKNLGLKFFDIHRSNNFIEFKNAIDASDYIVSPDLQAPGVFEWLPSAELRGPVLDYLKDQEYIPIRRPSPELPYFIYLNPRRTNTQSVNISDQSTGFLPPEGPYPQMSLHPLRWGLYPSSKIAIANAPSRKLTLLIDALSYSEGRTIDVLQENSRISRIYLKKGEFTRTVLEVPVQSAPIQLVYNGFDDPQSDVQRSVLYRDLRLIVTQ